MIVGHHLELVYHGLLLLLDLLLHLLLGDCSLVDVADVVQLGARIVDIASPAQDHRNVLDDPLPIKHDEFVAEGVRLHVADKPFDVVSCVKLVHIGVVKTNPTVDRELPKAYLLGTQVEHPLQNDGAKTDAEHPDHECGVGERIVRIPDHRSDAQVKEDDAPGAQTDQIIELR